MHSDEAAAYAAWIAGEPVPCTCGALLTRTTWTGRREDLDPHDPDPEGTWAHQGAPGEILETGHRAIPATWTAPPCEPVQYAGARAGRWSRNEHRWLALASHFAGLCGIQGEP